MDMLDEDELEIAGYDFCTCEEDDAIVVFFGKEPLGLFETMEAALRFAENDFLQDRE